MYKIWIVEDDLTIAGVLERQLCRWGFEASHAKDLSRVMEEFGEEAPHLVLLDISLPFYNGYHWCGEIRRISKVPVLFLSSATDNMSQMMALNMGADGFIQKPFDLDLVVATVQAVLRRAYSFSSGVEMLEHRGAILQLGEAALYYSGQKLDLTKNEFRILKVLMENKGRTVSRDILMKKLWESDSFIDDNTLTVNVNRLRRKLEEAGLEDFIRTKKGLGYIVEEA